MGCPGYALRAGARAALAAERLALASHVCVLRMDAATATVTLAEIINVRILAT